MASSTVLVYTCGNNLTWGNLTGSINLFIEASGKHRLYGRLMVPNGVWAYEGADIDAFLKDFHDCCLAYLSARACGKDDATRTCLERTDHMTDPETPQLSAGDQWAIAYQQLAGRFDESAQAAALEQGAVLSAINATEQLVAELRNQVICLESQIQVVTSAYNALQDRVKKLENPTP